MLAGPAADRFQRALTLDNLAAMTTNFARAVELTEILEAAKVADHDIPTATSMSRCGHGCAECRRLAVTGGRADGVG